ncbi:hypothetical protein ZWY2020_029590 [Hordeum vulgare]|nr:hypothetical protein ZWY2020_029590 [Hordeum vulgare]
MAPPERVFHAELNAVLNEHMTEYDPRLVAPACLYLASKVEESSDGKYRFEIKDILEMEMKLLEELDYYLVVFHPLLQDAGIIHLTQHTIRLGLVNDTYKMDLILIYPPYMIALACIYIARVENISMENLNLYVTYKIDSNRGLQEDKIIPVMNKLPSKA